MSTESKAALVTAIAALMSALINCFRVKRFLKRKS